MDNRLKTEEEMYYAALKQPPESRSGYVKAACGDDLELLERVELLLKIREGGNNFLESPLFIDQARMDTTLEEAPGSIIGKYKLLEQIGEGGMAVVYMAEQEQPIRRKVALKIIKLGMDTKQVIARFEAERQALALMDHPNIAQVIDAGATETGRPYFVMELVQGVSITEYCDQNSFSTKERLALFIQVCHAVQHAHQKGIIHRDIKPSNIMVTHRDGTAVPKIIDFGIAKATNQRLTEKTLFTRYAHIIGTPAYMSPEQAELSEFDIDTRSDIYSLGVLLYELLTGVTPFGEEQLRDAGYLKMQQVIREEEPTKPSTKLNTLGNTLVDVAERRKVSPDVLAKTLRGDLDWIVMKSLEKPRDRRYETADALALDIARHLDNEPVMARPPSPAYRLQKIWQRNKVICVAVLTVAITLLLGIGISLWQAQKAIREREKALQAQQIARESTSKARQQAYNSDMSLAFRALEENLFGRVQDIVSRYVPKPGKPDLRGWEWRYAWAQSQSDVLHIWDTPDDIGEVGAVLISPDQRHLISSDFPNKRTSYHHTRRLWDLETKQELKQVRLPSGSERGFDFSNSGDYLALHRGAVGLPHSGANDTAAIVIYHTGTWKSKVVVPFEEEVRSLSFSPNDTKLAVIGFSKAMLWDWRAKEIIREWSVEGSGAWLNTAAFFPDGRRLAIGGSDELRIVNLGTGQVEHKQPAPYRVIALAISPDSRYVAIGFKHANGEIELLNTTTWKKNLP